MKYRVSGIKRYHNLMKQVLPKNGAPVELILVPKRVDQFSLNLRFGYHQVVGRTSPSRKLIWEIQSARLERGWQMVVFEGEERELTQAFEELGFKFSW